LSLNHNFFFFIRGNSTIRKAHFVDLGERVKPRLSQTLTRDARLDSNSRPAVQISNPLPSRYVSWEHLNHNLCKWNIHFSLACNQEKKKWNKVTERHLSMLGWMNFIKNWVHISMKTSNDSADACSVVSISIAEHIIYSAESSIGSRPFWLGRNSNIYRDYALNRQPNKILYF